jgi:hypothetical protein
VIDDSELGASGRTGRADPRRMDRRDDRRGLPAQELYDLVGATLEEVRASN